MTSPVLQVDGLCGGYPRTPVLHALTFTVCPGRITVLSGLNGAGKTTLIATLAGHLPAHSGRILLQGRDITRWPAHMRARLGIGLVPQGRRLFADLTTAEHLALAAGRSGDIAAVLELLPALAARLSHRPPHLSGGEQQMLAIARGLLTRPKVLLLDEPADGLAPTVATAVIDLLAVLAADGMAILLADPNPHRHKPAHQLTLHRGQLRPTVTATHHIGGD